MPLVIDSEQAEEQPTGPRHELARKINPSYAQGKLVRAAYASHQAEAEMIQGLLLEEGIPSMVKRTGGFDVPDMLAAGPRDIYVPEGAIEIARELVGQPRSRDVDGEDRLRESGVRLGLKVGVAVVLIGVLVIITLFSGGLLR